MQYIIPFEHFGRELLGAQSSRCTQECTESPLSIGSYHRHGTTRSLFSFDQQGLHAIALHILPEKAAISIPTYFPDESALYSHTGYSRNSISGRPA